MKPQDLLARLEAGYEYDPMYGEICNERDRLANENDKLREELDAAKHDLSAFSKEIVASKAKNAKLRELVADLWTHCPADRYYCALCEYGNDDGSECKLADRMRELGIEV